MSAPHDHAHTPGHAHGHAHAHAKRFDASHAQRLNSDERRTEQPPARLLAALGPVCGQRWLDVGAGTGFFTLPLAAAVGAEGHVLAVDVQVGMLAFLRTALQATPLRNVTTLEAAAERLPLPDDDVDGALLAACYHELDDRSQVLGELARVLKPGGLLVVLDWLHADDSPTPLPEHGPPADQRVRLAVVEQELRGHGFAVQLRRDVYPGLYVALARLGAAAVSGP